MGGDRAGPKEIKLENVFMKLYAPNHMLAPKKGSSQKGQGVHNLSKAKFPDFSLTIINFP